MCLWPSPDGAAERLNSASDWLPQDSIQVHLKGGKGPIKVLTCEMDRPGDAATSDPDQQSRCFTTLEESRINTSTLHTGETGEPRQTGELRQTDRKVS